MNYRSILRILLSITCAAALYSAFVLTTGCDEGDGDGDVDADSDADTDGDADGDTDVDSDTDIDSDADGDSDAETETDGDIDTNTDFINGNPGIEWILDDDPTPIYELVSVYMEPPTGDYPNVQVFVEVENVSGSTARLPIYRIRIEEEDGTVIGEASNGAGAFRGSQFVVQSSDTVVPVSEDGDLVIAWGYPSIGASQRFDDIARIILTEEFSNDVSGTDPEPTLVIESARSCTNSYGVPAACGTVRNTGTATAYEVDVQVYFRNEAGFVIEDDSADLGKDLLSLAPDATYDFETFGCDLAGAIVDVDTFVWDFEVVDYSKE